MKEAEDANNSVDKKRDLKQVYKKKEINNEIQMMDTIVKLREVEIVENSGWRTEIRTLGMASISVCVGNEIIDDETLSGNEENKIERLEEDVSLFPNPAHDVLNLKLTASENKMTEVELFDMSGKLIRTFLSSQLISKGEADFQFDVSGLPPATYLLLIRREGEMQTKRVVIM